MLAAQQRSGRLGPATREKFKNTGSTARGRMPRTEFFCAVWWCMCTATEAYIPPQYTAFLLSLLTSKQTSEAVCPMDDQTGSLTPIPPDLAFFAGTLYAQYAGDTDLATVYPHMV